MPESLGNNTDDLLLNPGIVCDQCNNGRLALLDQALLDFPLIKTARVIGKIKNKGQKYPVLKSANNISMQNDGSTLRVTMGSNKNRIKPTVRSDGSMEVKITLNANQMTPKKNSVLARSLLKIAFEAAVMQNGVDWALEPKNDYIRSLILDGDELSHGFICITVAKSHDKCFQIKWAGFPPFVGLHNVLFTVGLVDKKESLEEVKEFLIREKQRALFW